MSGFLKVTRFAFNADLTEEALGEPVELISAVTTEFKWKALSSILRRREVFAVSSGNFNELAVFDRFGWREGVSRFLSTLAGSFDLREVAAVAWGSTGCAVDPVDSLILYFEFCCARPMTAAAGPPDSPAAARASAHCPSTG